MSSLIETAKDFRSIIEEACAQYNLTYKSLAESARIHPSYFSRVMKGDAHFSPEQLFRLARILKLEEWQLQLFLLLGERDATSDREHKSYVQFQIDRIRKENHKLSQKFKKLDPVLKGDDLRDYYSEPITSKIHMHLTIEKYRKNPHLIANKLLITETKLDLEIEKLLRLNIISKDKNQHLIMLKDFIHLDQGSPLLPSYHINWRLETIQYLMSRTPKPEDHHLSAVFSADPKVKLAIRELFREFQTKTQELTTEPGQNEEVFFISFDLF